MKKIKKADAINSDAYKYLRSIIHPTVKVVDLYVRGKWLMAELNSGIRFSVKNIWR